MCDYQAEALKAAVRDNQFGAAVGRSEVGAFAGRPLPSNDDIVSHHSPSPEQLQKITTIRAAARNFLDAIDANCPRSADATDAKRKVREAMMTANAAIVLNGAV